MITVVNKTRTRKVDAVILAACAMLGATACSITGNQAAPPAVDRIAIWSDTVQRGTLTLERLGRGTLSNADNGTLYADIRVPEAQSLELEIGQQAVVNLADAQVQARVAALGNEIVQGLRSVRLAFDGDIPERALPGMSLDARIQVDTIEDTLYVGRPAYGQEDTTISLFKIDAETDSAVRVPVRVGRSSYNRIEVLEGLEVGDQVILSDTSEWDSADRLALR